MDAAAGLVASLRITGEFLTFGRMSAQGTRVAIPLPQSCILFDMQPPIRLRDYQRQCLATIFDWYKAGAQTVLDRWEVVLRSPHPEVDGNVIASAHQLETAIAKADYFIRQTRPRSLGLADLQARWRRQPATEKQLERLKRAHLHVPPQISRGLPTGGSITLSQAPRLMQLALRYIF